MKYRDFVQDSNALHLREIEIEIRQQIADLSTTTTDNSIPAHLAGLRAEYFNRLSADHAESLGLIFAALSARCLRRASDAHDDKIKQLTGRENPREAYLANLRAAPHTVANLVDSYSDLSLSDAISEAARIHKLTPGAVEKSMRRAARESKTLRRIEIERLLRQGVKITEIAGRLGIDRTTVWRHGKNLSLRG